MPIFSVCSPWAAISDLQEPCATSLAGDPVFANKCLLAASDILFNLSGRQFAGVCQDTVRPEARQVITDHGRPIRPWIPAGWGYSGGGYTGFGAAWTGMAACNSTEGSCCTAIPEISLGGYPLTSIVQILIDGAVVDPSTYTISNNKTLIRTTSTVDGTNGGWPCCNDPKLPDTEVGTWSVTFTYGMPPPILGVLAAAELACQLALVLNPATAGSGSCQLPQRVVSVARQGITAVINDPLVFLDKGRTGMPAADLFLTATNPHNMQRRSTVTTPDIRRRVRRVG